MSEIDINRVSFGLVRGAAFREIPIGKWNEWNEGAEMQRYSLSAEDSPKEPSIYIEEAAKKFLFSQGKKICKSCGGEGILLGVYGTISDMNAVREPLTDNPPCDDCGGTGLEKTT